MNTIILALLLLVGPVSLAGPKTTGLTRQSLEVLHITPAGTNIPTARQIVFKFNQPMIPATARQHEKQQAQQRLPIEITPPVRCRWRWLERSTLACQLGANDALRPATTYQIKIGKALKAASGRNLSREVLHSFTTATPSVTKTHFVHWRSPGTPVIRIQFNMPVFKPSVASNLYLLAGKHQRYRIKVTHENKRAKSLYALSWLIEPIKPLPQGTQVSLMIEPGLLTKTGNLKGTQQKRLTRFTTFPEFRFLGVRCYSRKAGKYITSNTTNLAMPRCAPEYPVTLRFSTPFDPAVLLRGLTLRPVDPRVQKFLASETHLKTRDWGDSGSLHRAYEKERVYTLQLNRLLRPFTRHTLHSKPGLVDLFGQQLKGTIKLHIDTAHLKPALRVLQPVSVQSQATPARLLLELLNIDQVSLFYSFVSGSGKTAQAKRTLKLPQTDDQTRRHAAALTFDKQTGSGLITGWVRPALPSPAGSKQSHFITLVTPFHVQFKLGESNSLAWVTRLSDGKAVQGARVSLVYGRLKSHFKPLQQIASAVTGHSGIAMLPGRTQLKNTTRFHAAGNYEHPVLYLRVDKSGELALLPLTADFRVDNITTADRHAKPTVLKPWGLTAQRVYQAGDTIDYKLYVREQHGQDMRPARSRLYQLTVRDPLHKKIHQVTALRLNDFGAYNGRFFTAKDSPTGWYRFSLRVQTDAGGWRPLPLNMRVLVTAAKSVSFHPANSLNRTLYKPGDRLITNSSAVSAAGTPYAGAELRITTLLQATRLQPEVKSARGFSFGLAETARLRTINQVSRRLDAKGKDSYAYTVPVKEILYGRLLVEAAVRDNNGGYRRSLRTAIYAARDRYIGLRHDDWTLTPGQPSVLQTLVVDAQGNPAAGTAITVSIQQSVSPGDRHTHHGRVDKQHWKQVSECRLVSARQPQTCRFTPPQAGHYRFVATIRDSKGRSHTNTLQRWATGKTQTRWPPGPGHQLDITPEKMRYRAGEQLRILVKNPYPGASALVTVERNGVLDYKTVRLDDDLSVITLLVKKEYLPGFYVSVVLMNPARNRPAANRKSTAAIPAFRIGYARIEVEDRYRRLVIKIDTDKKTYRPGEQARLNIQVNTRHGTTLPAELAVTVVDETLFDSDSLAAADYDPYPGFYRPGRLQLHNFNLLTRFTGTAPPLANQATGTHTATMVSSTGKKHHTGSPRNGSRRLPLFKPLAYWNGRLLTDQQGRASIDFKLPDTPAAWRILVIATDDTGQAGLGQNSITVTRP